MDANGGYNEEILQVDRTLNRRIANHRGSRLFDLDTVHVQTDEATQYAEEGKVVDNRLEFGETTSKVGLILYPGEKVEKEAYAYDGIRLAEEGYFVAIPSLRLSELVSMFKHFFLFHSLVVRHQSPLTLQDFSQKKNPFLPSRKKKVDQRQNTVASTPAWSETMGPFSPSKTTA